MILLEVFLFHGGFLLENALFHDMNMKEGMIKYWNLTSYYTATLPLLFFV